MTKSKQVNSGDTPPEQVPKHKPSDPQRPAPARRTPPESIPDLMPGVDPQQTPGVDHPPAERE